MPILNKNREVESVIITVPIIVIFLITYIYLKKLNMIIIKQIENANLKAIIELAGATAHEIRQPLTGIIGICELLKYKYSQEPTISTEINKIKTQLKLKV